MKNYDLEQIILEAEGWIGRLKALQARHEERPILKFTDKQFEDFERMLTESPIEKNEKLMALMERQPQWGANHSPCPNHGNSFCLHYNWLPRETTGTGMALNYRNSMPCSAAPTTGYTAVDIATAAAEGFRDGRDSVVVELPSVQCIRLNGYCYEEVLEVCKRAIIAAGGKVKE